MNYIKIICTNYESNFKFLHFMFIHKWHTIFNKYCIPELNICYCRQYLMKRVFLKLVEATTVATHNILNLCQKNTNASVIPWVN